MVHEAVSQFMSENSKKGWALKTAEEKSAMMSERGKKGRASRWSKMSPEERKAHSQMMLKKKQEKYGK